MQSYDPASAAEPTGRIHTWGNRLSFSVKYETWVCHVINVTGRSSVFVKASKTHMLNKLSTVTLIMSLLPACGSTLSQNRFFRKMKASHSFHVTLANASGVSKYHTGPLIASILSYLKILQYAQPPDSWALKGLLNFQCLLITII